MEDEIDFLRWWYYNVPLSFNVPHDAEIRQRYKEKYVLTTGRVLPAEYDVGRKEDERI